jgi:hypothetical protein
MLTLREMVDPDLLKMSSRKAAGAREVEAYCFRTSRWTGRDLHGRIHAARSMSMAIAAKRQLALPATLSRELDQLARREGKSALAVLQDLVAENKQNRIRQEYRAVQGYWTKKAKAKGILTARDLQRYLVKP